jgi:hypothetical protein
MSRILFKDELKMNEAQRNRQLELKNQVDYP